MSSLFPWPVLPLSLSDLLSRKSESEEMVAENLLHREKEKNIVGSMLLAVCWNVDSVVQAFPDEDGIVIQNIRKQYGNV